ncbi:hypothetical protein EGW08_009284, partial [Elysia chlorotica]
KPTMEKIGSVQENPFFTKFGLKQVPVSRTRFVPDARGSSGRRLSSNGSVDGEEQPEYRPGSGFVHKLRDKWSHLNSREDAVLKKASSLEDLQPADDEEDKAKVISPRVSSSIVLDKKQPNVMHPPRLAYRAQSIESLSQVHRKTLPNNHRAGSQFVHHLRHVDSAWGRDKASAPPLKSPRGTHVEAPDVDLARDDIIIIETTPQGRPEDPPDNEAGSEIDDSPSPPHSYREEILPNELPKPNTVQTVRNIFETNSHLPCKSSLSQKRRSSGTPPSSLSLGSAGATSDASYMSSPSSSETSVSIRGFSPVTSPRQFTADNHTKSVTSPPASFVPGLSWNQANHSKPSAGESTVLSSPSYSSHSYRPGTGLVSGSSEGRDKATQPPTATDSASLANAAAPVPNVELKQASVLERSNFFESPRWGETRTTSSPRNTASVKPTISSKPSSPVKPLPLSTPASAATSYKRSSPVVPVAPFKDKKDDGKDDSLPVMIFSKSKLSPKKDKTPRINDYSTVNELPKGLPDDNSNKNKADVIINNDFKTRLHSKDSKTEIKRDNKLASIKNTRLEKNSQIKTDKIIHTPHQTTIQIGPSRKAAVPSETKSSKSAGVGAATAQPSALPTKRSQAPGVPLADKRKSQMAPLPRARQEGKSQAMLYVSSSESAESDSSTPPQTPRARNNGSSLASPEDTKASSQDKPIKGIPSIIANRTKADPSQVARNVVSSDPAAKFLRLDGNLNDESSTDSDASPRPPTAISSNTPSHSAASPFAVSLNSVSSSTAGAGSDPGKDALSSEISNEIESVRRKMESAKKQSSVAQIFSSSQLAEKRKKIQQQKALAAAAQAASQGIVPKLDLSGIDADRSKAYTPPQKAIKPCNIKFVGENAKTSRSLLSKNRAKKVNIRFSAQISETHEYPNEESALQVYLEEHPGDTGQDDGVIFMDTTGGGGGGFGESSDDKDDDEEEEEEEDAAPVTPRGDAGKAGEEELLKSNTALSSVGTLQSYRGRFQEDFDFGASLREREPEPVKQPITEPPAEDPDAMMLRPADEEENNTWSSSGTSDLLF